MAELKTFLFTDIVGSVELKGDMPGRSDSERDQAFIEQVLTPHRARIERELAALGGRVVSTAGDGHFLVFSDTVLAGLKLEKLGTSSVIYTIGLFRGEETQPAAIGRFVHVYVARVGRNVVPVPQLIRAAVERL